MSNLTNHDIAQINQIISTIILFEIDSASVKPEMDLELDLKCSPVEELAIVIGLETAYNIVVTSVQIGKLRTVQDIYDLIEETYV